MNPHRKWIAAIGCMFLAVAVAISQEKVDDSHNGVGVNLELLTLCNGLPRNGMATAFLVGGGIEVVYLRTIEVQSRWRANNAIEVTLKITEIDDAKRAETILLEGFEPKTLVLHEDPEHGRRELLRLIPVSKRVMEAIRIGTLPDKISP